MAPPTSKASKVYVSMSQGLFNIHEPGSFLTDENAVQTEPGPVLSPMLLPRCQTQSKSLAEAGLNW